MDSGAELATDLQRLWLVASKTLPNIAERWANANNEMHNNAADTGVFNRSSQVVYPYGGVSNATSTGPVYPYFDALRDDLQNIFAESATNTYDAAAAIITIMNNYADSDTEAKHGLEASVTEPHGVDTLKRTPVYRSE